MSKHYDKEFKENAVRYALEHEELSIKKSAKNLGLSSSALGDWIRKAKNNNGEVPTRGSGNYSSDEAKENARLRKELRDTQDALDILKKAIGILGK
ncbi:transposase [Clostridium sp. MSJ-8]|uniref:transposase n=1 Tax=Clostridium sp. MSJ-8 TaxID=2841510 RepID=UPI001C0EF026|nr:transposase [Clostridium sp. MSJ-8]MBU5486578.1 transposase [Clostridium sp. MSJ-8]